MIIDGSQSTKKAIKLACVKSESDTSLLSEESLSDVRAGQMLALSKRQAKKTFQPKIVCSPLLGRAQVLTEAEAHKIIGREVEAVIARMEPLDRLLDPIVQAALIGHHPAITSFLPLTEECIFNRYGLRLRAGVRQTMLEFSIGSLQHRRRSDERRI